MTKTAIENARIIRMGCLTRVNLLVEDEHIASIDNRPHSEADRRIDAKGRLVLPGLVDAHAHIYDPAFMRREDFTSGTSAAAAGGVTTVIEMVLSTPVDTPERIKAKIEEGERDSLIDFSLHAGMMNRSNLLNIGSIAAMGVRSFKAFMCKPYFVDDHTLATVMREIAKHNSITNVHAEDEETADLNFQRLSTEGRKDPMAHLEWKPNIVEEIAVKKAVEFARNTVARLHISHMSTAEGVAAVKRGKRHGVRVTAETCPHYLTFTRKDMREQGPYLKMNPSLKGPKDVLTLWNGLRDGTVDIVTSEHAPGERVEKEVGWTDIWKAWGGIPSIETMLPVLLSEGFHKGRISLRTLQRVCCEQPAKIFGFYPRKGALEKGADADIVIVDLKMRRKVRGEELHYKVGWTPYEGWMLKGWPILTMRRGKILYEDEEVLGVSGGAKFLHMSLRRA